MAHSIESIASSRKKTKENLRVESLVPLELREKAAPLIGLLEDYYKHINERGQTSYVLNNITNQRDIDYAESLIGNIERITVVNGGSGYSNSPTVTIIGDGTGAVGIARVLNGVIYAIDIAEGQKGWGYTEAIVTITDTTGANATAIATVSTASYLDLIQKEIAPAIPRVVTTDRVRLYKNLMRYYSVRGSTESIELFFKILFDDEADIYYPKRDLLIPSSGKWQTNLSRPAYTDAPTLYVRGNGIGARAQATVVNGAITSLSPNNPGNGYSTISLDIDGDGSGATAIAYTDYGKLTGININNGGTGYSTAALQIVDSIGGTGSGASAVAVTDYRKITQINVTHGGSGYVSATVLISGTGSGAKAYATLSTGGGINNIVITDQGYGYTSATATIFGVTARETLKVTSYVSTGTTTVTAHIASTTGITSGDYITIKNAFDTQYEKLNGSWQITSVTSNTLVFSVASALTAGTYSDLRMGKAELGSDAVLSVTIGTGTITNAYIINPGQNYVSPTVNIVGPGTSGNIGLTTGTGTVISTEITNPGSGYTTASVIVTGNGTNASFTPNIVNGAITSVTPIEVGSGYTNASISISGDGTGAEAIPVIVNGEITSYNVTSFGSGYTIPGVFLGYQLGIYNENLGFLSDGIKLQDSYFYQKFSYVIRTARNIDVWKDAFNKLVHPAGFIFFGEILVLIELLKQYAAMPHLQPGLISDEDIPLLILISGIIDPYDPQNNNLLLNTAVATLAAAIYKMSLNVPTGTNGAFMLKFFDASKIEVYRTMTIQEADGFAEETPISSAYAYDDYTINDVINNTIIWNDVQLGVNFT